MSHPNESVGSAPAGSEAMVALCFDCLADQFGRSWWMLRDAVARFTPEEWYSEVMPGMVPVR